MPSKPIVVPIDATSVAREAADLALRLAAKDHRTILLVYTIDSSPEATRAQVFGARANLNRLAASQRRTARKELARHETRLRRSGARVRTAILDATSADAFLRATRQLDPSLLVVPLRTLGQRVDPEVERLLRLAPCPVVTFQPKGRTVRAAAPSEPRITSPPEGERTTRPTLRPRPARTAAPRILKRK